jgi:hypothetical protein
VALEAGADVVEEHTESALGHEEVYIVLQWPGDVHARTTTCSTHRPAPSSSSATRRSSGMPRRGAGTQVLAIGGRRGEGFEQSPWEDFFAAEPLRAAGAYEAYVAALDDRAS